MKVRVFNEQLLCLAFSDNFFPDLYKISSFSSSVSVTDSATPTESEPDVNCQSAQVNLVFHSILLNGQE